MDAFQRGGPLGRLERRIQYSHLSAGGLSRPVAGLPLRRLIPQDVHSLIDYAGALAQASVAGRIEGRPGTAAAVLAAGMAVTTLSSDVRLGLLKLLPVELHEVLDYVLGGASILAPYVLGYARTHPRLTALQVASGALGILTSLFTDYRAARGRGRRFG
jgi:hypothetical protein